ncbi:MAG: hypothetical protein SGI74_11475 [Oligoflexia bacterium]|nr:hypothetical protein [Oligoflexia bacterium]
MTKTIKLIEEKNTYLEKFLGLNREWLGRLAVGDFGDLESFRENRENILNIVKHIDVLVDTQSQTIDAQDVDTTTRYRLNELLDHKDLLVKAILTQDLDIMQFIETAKSQIIIELRNVRQGRKTLSSYKSEKKNSESLDEKA